MSASLKVHATLGPLSFDVEGSPVRIAALLNSLRDSGVAKRPVPIEAKFTPVSGPLTEGQERPEIRSYKLPGRSPSVTHAELRAALKGESIVGLTDREQDVAKAFARELHARGEL